MYVAVQRTLGESAAREQPCSHAGEGFGRAPGIGTARSELGEGIRMWPHGRYLIFYREQGQAIRIERILHSSRDIDGDDFLEP